MSVSKAAAFATAELGVGLFFVAGVTAAGVGASAPWFVLAACAIGAFLREVDIESWATLIPGGLTARAERAFGPRVGTAAASCVLVERVLLTSLASLVAGHYAARVIAIPIAGWRLPTNTAVEDLSLVLAMFLLGLLWLRARIGRDVSPRGMAAGIWAGIGLLAVVLVWAIVTAIRVGVDQGHPVLPPAPPVSGSWPIIGSLVTCMYGLGLALPIVGAGDGLSRDAHEFPQPRVQALRQVSAIVIGATLCGAAVFAFLFWTIAPSGALPTDAILVDLAGFLAGGGFARWFAAVLASVAALSLIAVAARAAFADSEQTVRRLAVDRVLPDALSAHHPRFGTMAHAIDVSAAAAGLLIVVSSGQVTWLSHAYAIALAATIAFKAATLARLRRVEGPAPFSAPFNARVGGRDIPIGLITAGVMAIAAGVGLAVSGDVPAIATASGLAMLAAVLSARRRSAVSARTDELDHFELLPSGDLSLAHVQARPGNLLVTVRNPRALAHVAAALQSPGDRDVVVMTVRLLGVDVDADASEGTQPTPAERHLLSHVVALAERYHRPVRLLIVPARNVFDAVVDTMIRLGSSDVYVGESVTLTVADQARMLGDAWERGEGSRAVNARLVIHHSSGRKDVFHLGAHPPSLTSNDLDLIHRVWLDAVKAVGPHVHHHDVVRAALTQMEQQLSGPQRDEALAAIRQIARPADELAEAVRQRDFSRLRDMVRNRDPQDLAAVLTELSVEDQVVAFRVLPRKDAAAVFEYLSHDEQETLLTTMGKEDVAALLSNMAPDDRTTFLEELPAAATRQLLALLTPAQRSVAVALLGYPEESIGRLMTPHYVAVREQWTVREALDYIREHGQDSETLNVIYVVDDRGLLIDDIRIRELLLTSTDAHISDLMDRRFVALKATDDQKTAVTEFRKYDRTALPVTDTAGMLIGIVTIDDVLDVAEETATADIQRIGGSEALDEPYIEIGFGRMIRKRAGWLTALFLGEMLTATAMGAFEAEISRAVVLALFVPLIISSGGNSGSQASSLVIRALALGEVGLADWWRVMRRELLAGLALGTILGSIGFFRITLWSAFSTIYGEHWFLVAITVAFALIGVVVWGTLIGSLLPLVLRRLGFDPATSSAPFVATLVDVTGLIIYFSVALVVLRGTLL